MHLHIFTHVPFEGPGSIADWARAKGHTLAFTRWYAGEKPPPLRAVDALVVMGGPMSVYERDRHPWLEAELACVREALRGGRRVLGVCLGAQLMAAALGARVYASGGREIGWFPVQRSPEAARHPFFRRWPAELDVLHWHGDTFDLPEGATHLFSSEATPNQAFAWGPRAVALQFHLELRSTDLRRLARRAPADLAPGPRVQTRDELFADLLRFRRTQRRMTALLDALATA